MCRFWSPNVFGIRFGEWNVLLLSTVVNFAEQHPFALQSGSGSSQWSHRSQLSQSSCCCSCTSIYGTSFTGNIILTVVKGKLLCSFFLFHCYQQIRWKTVHVFTGQLTYLIFLHHHFDDVCLAPCLWHVTLSNGSHFWSQGPTESFDMFPCIKTVSLAYVLTWDQIVKI